MRISRKESMKTIITIEFEEQISEENLEKLMGQIHCQCSEDEERYSWGGGDYTVTAKPIK